MTHVNSTRVGSRGDTWTAARGTYHAAGGEEEADAGRWRKRGDQSAVAAGDRATSRVEGGSNQKSLMFFCLL